MIKIINKLLSLIEIYFKRDIINIMTFVILILWFLFCGFTEAKESYFQTDPYYRQIEKFYDQNTVIVDRSAISSEDLSKIEPEVDAKKEVKEVAKITSAEVEKKEKSQVSIILDTVKDFMKDVDTKIKDAPPVADLNGYYMALKFYGSYLDNINFSVYEQPYGSTRQTLVNGSVSYSMAPSPSFAIGQEGKKYYRYEVELNYLPLFVTSFDSINSSYAKNSSFDISSNTLSADILNLSLNGFLKFNAPFTSRIMCFVGGGIGFGYGIPRDDRYLSGDIIFPSFQGIFGVNTAVTSKIKVGIYFKISYMNMSLHNKSAFNDTTLRLVDHRPIKDGYVEYKDLLTQSLGLELSFY